MGGRSRHKDVPQTVGYAADQGWQWLRAQCAYCRRSGRVMLADRPRGENLAALAARMTCRRCKGATPMLQLWVGATHGVHQKPIAFDGTVAISVNMN